MAILRYLIANSGIGYSALQPSLPKILAGENGQSTCA
jgi:hypothetical protein